MVRAVREKKTLSEFYSYFLYDNVVFTFNYFIVILRFWFTVLLFSIYTIKNNTCKENTNRFSALYSYIFIVVLF